MITIKLNQKELERIRKAGQKVIKRARWWMEDNGGELPRRASLQFVNKLAVAISTEKYSAGYAQYHPQYRNWKAQWASIGWWKIKGDLLASLTTWMSPYKTKGGWMAGIPGGVMDSGGKSWWYRGLGGKNKGKRKKIAMIATTGEFGGNFGKGGTHPARPVFQPTMDDYYEEDLPKLADQALDAIGGAWV